MVEENGLIHAILLNGNGGGDRIGWGGVSGWTPDRGVLWVHLDRNDAAASDWVQRDAGLDPVIAEALLDVETRPRTLRAGEGQLIILRGVNLNPGAEPEDMVGLRIWSEERRLITIRYRRLMAIVDVTESLDAGTGSNTTGDLMAKVAGRLVDRMKPVLTELGEQIDAIETNVQQENAPDVGAKLSDVRNVAIVLKRYLAPQRDVLAQLAVETHGWISSADRACLRETGNDVTRYVEELEEIRERAIVVQDELVTRFSEAANKRIYILTIISAIMLPLSLITGLLGINVAGLPGTDNSHAFWIVCLALIVFGGVEYWILRRLKWL
jgi:zinc transporter